jgi:hypothetical protein
VEAEIIRAHLDRDALVGRIDEAQQPGDAVASWPCATKRRPPRLATGPCGLTMALRHVLQPGLVLEVVEAAKNSGVTSPPTNERA